MTDKLKPCPFCEGEAIIHSYGFNQYSVGCSECWVETNRTAGVESAVKQWNTRKPMDRIVRKLEEQKNENGVLAEMDWYGGMSQGFHEAIEIVKDGAE